VLIAACCFTFVAAGAGNVIVRRCQASYFEIRQGPKASALAHYRQTVRLRNVTNAACSMTGWFKVQLLDEDGKVLPSHEQRISSDMFGSSPRTTVDVKPGAGASFAIDTTAPATSCPHSAAIAITPPGGHGAARLKLSVLACSHFTVLPVQPDNHALHP
jgi:Protein of unknown function (DUF4232)